MRLYQSEGRGGVTSLFVITGGSVHKYISSTCQLFTVVGGGGGGGGDRVQWRHEGLPGRLGYSITLKNRCMSCTKTTVTTRSFLIVYSPLGYQQV